MVTFETARGGFGVELLCLETGCKTKLFETNRSLPFLIFRQRAHDQSSVVFLLFVLLGGSYCMTKHLQKVSTRKLTPVFTSACQPLERPRNMGGVCVVQSVTSCAKRHFEMFFVDPH